MTGKSEKRTLEMSERARTALGFVAVIGLMATWMVGFGYYNYLHDQGRQNACDEAFGAGSEWVGNAFNPGGAVCETPSGETEVVRDVSSLPMSLRTLGGYFDHLGDAVGGLLR